MIGSGNTVVEITKYGTINRNCRVYDIDSVSNEYICGSDPISDEVWVAKLKRVVNETSEKMVAEWEKKPRRFVVYPCVDIFLNKKGKDE